MVQSFKGQIFRHQFANQNGMLPYRIEKITLPRISACVGQAMRN
jgi:hypothetical protein